MSGPEIVDEVNALSAKTWDSKVKNILRLLDDNSYAGDYTWVHSGDLLIITFTTKVFNIDLSSDATERQVLSVVDDYFADYQRDRSYKMEGEGDVEI